MTKTKNILLLCLFFFIANLFLSANTASAEELLGCCVKSVEIRSAGPDNCISNKLQSYCLGATKVGVIWDSRGGGDCANNGNVNKYCRRATEDVGCCVKDTLNSSNFGLLNCQSNVKRSGCIGNMFNDKEPDCSKNEYVKQYCGYNDSGTGNNGNGSVPLGNNSSPSVPYSVGNNKGLVPCGGSNDPCTLCHLIIGIKRLVDWGLGILVTMSLAAITIAGVMYVLSSGSEKMITAAKSFLSSSLIGFAIVLGAWLLINVTMNILAAKTDLGIGKSGWTKFSCSTASSALTGSGTTSSGSPTGTPGAQKCCVKEQSKDGSGYGNASNCSEAKTTTKADCEKYWTDYYKDQNKEDELKAKLAACKDESACSEGTAVDGGCSTLPACGGTPPTGSENCAATNSGCGGLSLSGPTSEDCNHTSAELASKLACLKGKGVGAVITSITKNGLSNWCDKCVKSYSGAGTCAHSATSCHWGGTKCKGVSQAVDLTASDAVASAAMACGFDSVIWKGKELRSGRSASDHTDHVHASVNNSSCGCDYNR